MALESSSRRKKLEEIASEPKRNDLAAIINHAKENPLLWSAGAVFIAAVILVGVFYRISTDIKNREAATKYARAVLDAEDPAVRATELSSVNTPDASLDALALYMNGQAALDAENYDKAREVFETVRTKYPEARVTPESVAALGFIAEQSGDHEKALSYYLEVREKWPESFAAYLQPLNMGRCYERLGQLDKAVAAYRDEVNLFYGSNAAAEAEDALNRLRNSHPELFAEETAPEAEASAADSEPTPSGETEPPPSEETLSQEVPSEPVSESTPPPGQNPEGDDGSEEEADGSAVTP
jgi:tetratricopeptide (TPR) repeat protein